MQLYSSLNNFWHCLTLGFGWKLTFFSPVAIAEFSKIAGMLSVARSVSQFSHSVMPNSLWSHGMQHARLPCPSPNPRACTNSWSSSQWCHPTISSSVIPFSSCFQYCPASGSFTMNQFFTSGSQSTGALASVLVVIIQNWFPLGLTALISLSPRDSQESSLTPHFKSISSLALSFVYNPTLTSHTWLLEKPELWPDGSLSAMLLCNMLSSLIIAFLSRSKCILISWLQSPSAEIWEL